MHWTRLEGTDLWNRAKAAYQADPRRAFHNWHHIERRYMHAAVTFGLPYDYDLDKGILTHDVIYDDKPFKELRSALWLNDNDPEESYASMNHVLATACHAPGRDNRMVLIDLADLMFPERIASDRELVKREIIALTGITKAEFAAGNAAYFQEMHSHLDDHVLASLPAWERKAFRKIRTGIEMIVEIAEAEIKVLAR